MAEYTIYAKEENIDFFLYLTPINSLIKLISKDIPMCTLQQTTTKYKGQRRYLVWNKIIDTKFKDS